MKKKHIKKIGLCILSALASQKLNAFELYGNTFFSPRSQSANAARDLVGWHSLINYYNRGNVYGALAITPSYGQILRQKNAAFALFSTDNLFISGSLVPNRDENDILADYFGLSPAFESNVFLEPMIKTAQVDIAFYMSVNDIYFRFHAPVVATIWKLGMDEIIENVGCNVPYPAHYMSNDALFAPATSFCQAVRGGITFGDVKEGLRFGKFCSGQTRAGLSDIEMALGWNIINKQHGHAGLNVRVTAPTGTRPTSEFLFEPIVGNGKHWELGAGFSGHVLLWEKDGQQEFSFFTDLNMMHIFKAKQHRSFDFVVNGLGSRYVLLKTFDASGQYTRNSLPAINVTTLPCKVRNSIQIDWVAMLGYTYNNFLFDIGYELWFRSHDIVDLEGAIPNNTFGFKGIQNVTTMAGDPDNTTQSTATLGGNNLSEQSAVADPNSPVFISTCDLDIDSASTPRALTNKIFAHIGWVGNDYNNCLYTPFIGIGGELEFEGINTRETELPSKNTLSQWNMWIKAGVGF